MIKMNMPQVQSRFDNSKEEVGIFISFILAIFPLSFVINCYVFTMRNLEQNQGTKNVQNVFLYVLFFLIIGLMLVLIYIVNSAIKIQAPRYSLLFMLGIKKKDFWKILYKDYFLKLMLIGISSTIIINFVSICVANIIWNHKKQVLLEEFFLSYFIGTGLVCAILILLILMVVTIAFYYSLKKEMIEFWEGLNQNIIFKYDTRLLYYLKPILGIFVEVLVIVFCLDYRTIYYAAILQGISFYLISSSTECLRWITKYNQKKDYKNIISSNRIMYQYKLNCKLIMAIYLLNFIAAFVVGGFILSDLSDKEQNSYQVKYPYEFVVYGDNINFSHDSYPFFQGETEEGKEVAIFSLSSYEKITKRKETLSEYEIIYVSQHSPEDFAPLTGKQDLKVYYNSKEAICTIKDSRWEIIFGENMSLPLEDILVVNDNEFQANADCIMNLWYGDTYDSKIEKGLHVWNRTEAIEKEKENNRYVMILVYSIGIFLMLEGQGIILIKQIANHSSMTEKYRLLYTLGMTQKDRKKYFFEEIRKIAFYPTMLGFFRGILMLGLIYFYQEGLSGNVFIYYLVLCAITVLIQYASYYCIAFFMLKLYESDLETS